MKSSLVISLDFELFWGVIGTRSLKKYGSNIEGEWEAIPKILALFKQYGINATWATVGMLMCQSYSQWRSIRPTVMPEYPHEKYCPYSLNSVVQENPKLFFGRSLVEQILATPGQEIASHSYSHFHCSNVGATPKQFAADLVCARFIAAEMGIKYRSFVFPRNQVREAFLKELNFAGYKVFRGNPDHWLYRHGHFVSGGQAGRAIRLADSYFSISGNNEATVSTISGLANLPASLYLRPWSGRFAAFEPVRLMRVKRAMTAAAYTGRVFHLWWHPHNFGINIGENLLIMESLILHYLILRDKYGMQSAQIGNFSAE